MGTSSTPSTISPLATPCTSMHKRRHLRVCGCVSVIFLPDFLQCVYVCVCILHVLRCPLMYSTPLPPSRLSFSLPLSLCECVWMCVRVCLSVQGLTTTVLTPHPPPHHHRRFPLRLVAAVVVASRTPLLRGNPQNSNARHRSDTPMHPLHISCSGWVCIRACVLLTPYCGEHYPSSRFDVALPSVLRFLPKSSQPRCVCVCV